jgi:hypothetical protein
MAPDQIEEGLRSLLSPREADGLDCSLDLYNYSCGQATEEQKQAFESHMATCPHCRQDVSDFQRLTREESQPQITPSRVRWFFWIVAPVTAALLVLAVLLLPTMWNNGESEGFRIKGGYRLQVAVQRDTKRFSASSQDVFHTGDVLGFFYTAPSPAWLFVFFADEEQKITQIFPRKQPEKIAVGAEKPLPNGAVLETSNGKKCEWIVAFFSTFEQPINQNVLTEALQKAIQNRKQDCVLAPIELPHTATDITVMRRVD